jgi:cytochrome c oxidase subunit I+III
VSSQPAALAYDAAQGGGGVEPPNASALEQTWGNPFHGARAWFSDISHRAIGLRFLVSALIFFLLGGVEALLMRLQLARANNQLIGPDLYDQLFTVHGSTMMFLFAVPVMQGFGVYLVPLMIGTRESAFPRLQAYAYYTYVIGGLLLYAGLLSNTGPDAGWFSYVPLSSLAYGLGKRVDVWAQLVTFTELSALSTAVNLIATIFKHRAPGMSLDRMPLFVWAMLVQSFMVIFAMPAIMLGSLLLAMDRLVHTHFFDYAAGGDVLLWQHMFWFFGHPEVYIIFVPALGMLSMLIIAFTSRQVFGYNALVLSLVATGFVGFGLWVHHMFATPLPGLGKSFFTAASLLIAFPAGVQFFCWIATLWRGSIRLEVPMLFALAFFAEFVIGGVTGVMLGSVPLNLQLHDTFFIVAHLHYVLIGGAVFPLLGGVYFWYPKLTGRMLNDRLGRWNFWLFVLGFNAVFFPLHILGLRGMPRRVYTYGSERGWDALNLLATAGACVLAIAVLLLLWNLWHSRRHGALAGPNPWHAASLEWAVPSPPPSYNFAELPTVNGRYALWTLRRAQPIVHGVENGRREVLVTRLVDAQIDHRSELPGPTLWPLWAALASGVTFIVAIFSAWAIPGGALLLGVALCGWYWPKAPHRRELLHPQPTAASEPGALQRPSTPHVDVGHLATSAFGSRDPLFWGVTGMLAIEGSVFALLFVSYLDLRNQALEWPPAAFPTRSAQLAAAGLALLIASCVPMQFASRAALKGSLKAMRWGLLLATVFSCGFLALRFLEFAALTFRWDAHAYGSIFWTILGMHTMHGIIGSAENVLLLAALMQPIVEEKQRVDVNLSGPYWYFIVIGGALCDALLYLDPLYFAR